VADDQKGAEPAIELVALRRVYGERAALNDLSLKTTAGASLVVLGPNGAGKTTLIRILATLLRPTGGEVRVLGCKLPDEAWKLRGKIGYLGHEPLLYRDLTARENLRFHAKLHGWKGERATARIEELLAKVNLSHRGDERTYEFSAGMRQRLAICRTVLHEPELLLLDEPDSNLDIEGREVAKTLIGPGLGHTRVVVTHDPDRYLPEADQVLRLGIDEKASLA
jgi:heme exporter protein A